MNEFVESLKLSAELTTWPVTKRRKLPETRPSTIVHFEHCGMDGYLIVGFYPDTDQPGEVFIVIAKEGTFTSAALDMVARQTSFLLQRGVPAQLVIDGWRHHVVDPMGAYRAGAQCGERGSMFDALAAAFVEACDHYGECNPSRDHLKREVP